MKRNGRKSLAGALARAKNESGFTLVELIVVIAILGILAGVGTVGYSGYIKKANMAADEILLDSLNTAFAAACIENGVDASTLADDSVSETWSGKKVTAVSEHNEAFVKYFGEGVNSEFKVMTDLTFKDGMFVGLAEGESISITFAGVTITISGEDIQNFKESAFATVGADNLLTMVDMAAGMIDITNATSDLAKLATSAEAEAFLFDRLGIDNAEEIYASLETMYPQGDMGDDEWNELLDKKYNQVWANNAVLYAAQNSQAVSEGIWDVLKAESVKDTIKSNTNTEQQLAQSAMAFAMYSAYTKTDSLEGIQLTDVYDTLDSEAFKRYLETDDAKDDLSGYLSAMNMVNDGVASGSAAAEEVLFNGFSSEELTALMGQVLRN